MRTVRIGDVAEQVRGVTFSKADTIESPRDGYTAVLTAGNIQDGEIVNANLTFVPSRMVRDKQQVRENDVVVCTSSGSLSVVGKAARSRGDFSGGFGAFLKVLRPSPAVDPGYFAHFFQTQDYRRRVSALAAGANINNLKNDHLDEFALPLPSFPEQRRIAAILDHADTLRAKRRQVLTRLDSLITSTFNSMFDLGDLPAEPLGAHIVEQQIGLDRRAADQGTARAYDYLKMDAITRDGRLDLRSITCVDATPTEVAKFSLHDGDLLFNTRNSRELVGKSAVYRGRPRLYNNNIMRIRLSDGLLAEFVHRYLWTNEGKRQLDARKSGTTSVFAIYAKSLATLLVPIPPLETQAEFAARAARIEVQRVAIQRAVAAGDELFAALQSRAFRGEL